MNIDEIWQVYSRTKAPEEKEKLVLHYLPFVKFIVGRIGYKNNSFFDYEDLVAYGIIGLLSALEKFDYSKNIKFETFAYSRIKGNIIDAFRKYSSLTRSAAKKVQALSEIILENPSDEVSTDYIQQKLGMGAEEVSRIFDYLHFSAVDSLDKTLFDANTQYYDILADPKTQNPSQKIEEEELTEMLQLVIKSLNEREQLILSLYYFEKLTLKEIGGVLGVNESRVCQLHAKIILKMRAKLTSLGYIEV